MRWGVNWLLLTTRFGKRDQWMSTRSLRAHGGRGDSLFPSTYIRVNTNSDKDMQTQQEFVMMETSHQNSTLHKKWSFTLRIFSVNVTKSWPVSCRFDHIYWRNSSWKTSFFVQWSTWFENYFGSLLYIAYIRCISRLNYIGCGLLLVTTVVSIKTGLNAIPIYCNDVGLLEFILLWLDFFCSWLIYFYFDNTALKRWFAIHLYEPLYRIDFH